MRNKNIFSLIIISLIFLYFTTNVYSLRKEFVFLGLKLGMTQTDVTNVLSENSFLKIDESRFFGKINDAVPFIIKANYYPFIDNLYIQFYNDSAYGITLQFNPGYFDFLSLSEKLQDKYGPPLLRTSKLVLWENGTNSDIHTGNQIKLRLEYPSTVKVFDYAVMQQVNTELSQSTVKITNESIIQSNRRALLDEL